MIRVNLSAEEAAAIEQEFKDTTDRRVRNRCQAVLMAYRGRKRQAIAEDLGVHRTTVKKWLDRYQMQGREGLHVRRAPGKPPRIPDTEAPTISEWVKGGRPGAG
jgi:transposase